MDFRLTPEQELMVETATKIWEQLASIIGGSSELRVTFRWE